MRLENTTAVLRNTFCLICTKIFLSLYLRTMHNEVSLNKLCDLRSHNETFYFGKISS